MDKPSLSANCTCGHKRSRHAGKLHDKDCTFDLGNFQFCKCRKFEAIPKKPTIYKALVDAELKADWDRILREATVEPASKGKLKHQKKRTPK